MLGLAVALAVAGHSRSSGRVAGRARLFRSHPSRRRVVWTRRAKSSPSPGQAPEGEPLAADILADDVVASIPQKEGGRSDVKRKDDGDLEEMPEGASMEDMPEKWVCPSCNTSNFAAALECQQCGAPKPTSMELELFSERASAQDAADKIVDSFLRLQAELQNLRRKRDESISRVQELGQRDAILQLVPITVAIERALEVPSSTTAREARMFESYSLIFKKVFNVWDRFGLRRLEAQAGDLFDTCMHRQVESRVAMDERQLGTILAVLDHGWMCEGEVLIPSKVVVAVSALGEVVEDLAGASETAEAPGDVED